MTPTTIIEGEFSAPEMTRECARDLTDRINATADDLAGMLQRAHEGKAWLALGYESWKAYVSAEIKVGQRRVFQLLDFAEIREQVNPGSLDALTEKSARVLKNVEPEKRAEVFETAIQKAGGKPPTAKQVEAVVVKKNHSSTQLTEKSVTRTKISRWDAERMITDIVLQTVRPIFGDAAEKHLDKKAIQRIENDAAGLLATWITAAEVTARKENGQ